MDTSFSSNRGDLFPKGSFGHTGFTGTSIWIDPTSQTFVVSRLIGYGLLQAASFPPSFIPWMILPLGLMIDLTAEWRSKAMAVTLGVVGVAYVAATLVGMQFLMPEFPITTAPIAAGIVWAMYRALLWVERNVPEVATLRGRA